MFFYPPCRPYNLYLKLGYEEKKDKFAADNAGKTVAYE